MSTDENSFTMFRNFVSTTDAISISGLKISEFWFEMLSTIVDQRVGMLTILTRQSLSGCVSRVEDRSRTGDLRNHNPTL
jgi:hypothetical protein